MTRAEYERATKEARKAAGVCVQCGKRDAAPFRVKCDVCRIRDSVLGSVRRSAKRRAERG